MKTLYELGEMPPLGRVPEKMYASTVRQDRFGTPASAIRTEVVDVPPVGRGQVLVYIMAAGINYNGVWTSLGEPIDVIAMRWRQGATEDFHIGGSEGAGVVWAVGPGVEQVKVGDEVTLSSCQWDETARDVRLGADPMTSVTQRAWGYETNYGSFAQFALVDEYQCHPKPPRMTWEEAGCFIATAATAYRQLCGWEPHTVRIGDPVLIWGGAGGLGSMAIQITALKGGLPIAVVSTDERGEHCLRMGAKGVINRTEFDHWGRMPDHDDVEAMAAWSKGVQAFGRRIWEILGEKRAPRIVFEHTGQDTLPTSMFVCDTAGMVVTCGGTSGYNGDLDLRYLWMRQKRLQGSHFANTRQCHDVVELANRGQLDPCLSWCGGFEDIGKAHQMMYENVHPSGNMAVLVNAPTTGLTTAGLAAVG
ncbi:crotonyl-CoA carboxylase/reductase [Streptomyces sp. NPDC056956]|uniref:crotonyl-CoA carboxylase/reductase n=1 Tax=unclassified Streptomyces TaxID=2593676 RepID=UPI00362BF34F